MDIPNWTKTIGNNNIVILLDQKDREACFFFFFFTFNFQFVPPQKIVIIQNYYRAPKYVSDRDITEYLKLLFHLCCGDNIGYLFDPSATGTCILINYLSTRRIRPRTRRTSEVTEGKFAYRKRRVKIQKSRQYEHWPYKSRRSE